MTQGLIVVPAISYASLERVLPSIDIVCPADRTIAAYSGTGLQEFKKLLIDHRPTTIVIAFPSLLTELPSMQVIKSILPDSRCIVFCPDLRFMTNDYGPVEGGEYQHGSWRHHGSAVELNMCRQADLIVCANEGESSLLRQQDMLSEVPVTTLTELMKIPSPTVFYRLSRKKKVSIIMLTFNQVVDTRQCLDSLFKYTPLDQCELIFVDNGSVDGTRDYLRQIQAEHKETSSTLIFNDDNLGFAKACNQGIRIATGDYILLLNNDVVLVEKWLQRLVQCAESDPRVGVVGPCTNQAVAQQVISLPEDFTVERLPAFAAAIATKNAGYWIPAHRIIGFCMLIKKEILHNVGMLDERFGPGGYEDFDFCLRVKQRGYQIIIASDVFLYHVGGQGYHHNNLDYDALRKGNVRLFIAKWYNKVLRALEIMPDGL
jgi:GT2 family glycosyltransferase